MENYSRTEKYKKLRDSLHNDADTDADIGTKELSRYESRLNRIDSNNFRAPQNYLNDDHDAAHARNTVYEEPLEEEEPEEKEPVFDTSFLGKNENYTSSFDNDYLDQYIREVKEYNKEQGYAVSDKTAVNVLNAMNSGSRQRGNTAPLSPYPDAGRPRQAYRDTADIPFVSPRRNVETGPSRSPIQDEYRAFDEPVSRTKEDIMAEVQNMVNGTKSAQIPNMKYAQAEPVTSSVGTDTFSRRIEEEKNAREQMTTQMQAQLDDYEDNLSEISDRMRHTNRILNIVLVILIVALSIVLIFIIYWNIIARGGIS